VLERLLERAVVHEANYAPRKHRWAS
jgi:hypothetical protein